MQHPPPPAALDGPRRAYAKPTLDRREALGAVTAGPPVSAIADFAASDVRLKEDISCIGTTAHGLPFYRFRYRGRPGVYEGVLAQEALRVMPEAVARGADGFLMVNYRRLGAPFRRLR
jgi:hypothetical protein